MEEWSECVGCGYCCREAPCSLAQAEGITEAPCPLLEWDGTKWRCSRMLRGPDAEDWKEYLYTGEGCCSSLNSDRLKIPTPNDLEVRV